MIKYNHNSNCRLCKEIEDFRDSLFVKKCPGILKKNMFFETKRLQIMIPIGPLFDGHLLIATRSHYWSYAELGVSIIPELEKLIDFTIDFLHSEYRAKRVIVFEHGAISKTERGGCCLDHAHMNIVPIPETFELLMKASRHFKFSPVQIISLEKFVLKKTPYLFFKCSQEGSYAAPASASINQFFRKLLAPVTPMGNWDWRSNYRIDSMKATATALESYMSIL